MSESDLKRRTINGALALGLACVFVCIAASVALSWHGRLLTLAPLVATLPLALLLVGGVALRRTLRGYFAIEEQLRELAAAPAGASDVVRPVRPCGIATEGWNRLADSIRRLESGVDLLGALEAALGNSEDSQWCEVIDTLPDGLMITDAEDRVRFVNQTLRSQLTAKTDGGLSANGVWKELLCRQDGSELPRLADQQNFEAVTLHRGDRIEDGVLRVTRMPLGGGGAGGDSVWLISDITQRQIADRNREDFVATASHELRTPLANIRAYAESLATVDDIDVEQQKDFLNIINAEAARLARFVDDLLGVSQMEAGAIAVVKHETDMMKLIQEVAAHIQPLMDSKKQQFKVAVPAKLPTLMVDKEKLASALTNLLSNANKYTPAGGNVVLAVQADTGRFQIHVEDSGIGVDAEEINLLGRKFFRSVDPRVQAETGSGIGLSFCFEVARLHGGDLKITSELNKGSRFTITLPMPAAR